MQAIIEVSGSSYEQGLTQGKLLAQEISQNIAFVNRELKAINCDMERYNQFVDKNVTFLKNVHPDQLEEMQGISHGSGIPLEEIYKLNIPAYFMTSYFTPECSMCLARGKATADGQSYLIKNRDMRVPITQAVIKRNLPDGSHIMEVNGVGTVTYPANGMNSHGLMLATTGFWSSKTTVILEDIINSHIFVNIHFLLRDCKTVREVIEALKVYPRMNGLNIIAADKNEAVAIETTRDNMFLEWDKGDGVLIRTNHYILEDSRWLNDEITPTTTSFARRDRIEAIMRERYGKIRFQDMWRALSDHSDGRLCVCRHPMEGMPGRTMSTSLMVLEDLETFTSVINPCEALRYAKL